RETIIRPLRLRRSRHFLKLFPCPSPCRPLPIPYRTANRGFRHNSGPFARPKKACSRQSLLTFPTRRISRFSRHSEQAFMRRLFPSFDGPVRVSPYVLAPRKRRWWPTAAAFGAGMGCVLVVVAPWKHGTDLAAKLAPATQSASPDLQVMSVEAASANTTTQTVSPSVPAAPLDLDGAPARAETEADQPMPHTDPTADDVLAPTY